MQMQQLQQIEAQLAHYMRYPEAGKWFPRYVEKSNSFFT